MKKLILMLMLFAPIATFAQKFGHVNAQAVMESLPEFIKARAEVEGQAKVYDNQLKEMQTEIQKKAEEYDKTQATMNDTKRKETEATLQDLYQKFQQAQQDNAQAIQKLLSLQSSRTLSRTLARLAVMFTSWTSQAVFHTSATLSARTLLLT